MRPFFCSLCSMLVLSNALAQDMEFFGNGREGRRWLRKLSAKEAREVRLAYQAAMKDPQVQAAKQKRDESNAAYHNVLRATMVHSNPIFYCRSAWSGTFPSAVPFRPRNFRAVQPT